MTVKRGQFCCLFPQFENLHLNTGWFDITGFSISFNDIVNVHVAGSVRGLRVYQERIYCPWICHAVSAVSFFKHKFWVVADIIYQRYKPKTEDGLCFDLWSYPIEHVPYVSFGPPNTFKCSRYSSSSQSLKMF